MAAAPSLPPTQTVDYTPLLNALQAAPNYAGLAKQARAQAGQETATTVQGLRAQQDQINRQAAVRAQQIDQATMAAAHQLAGLHLAGRLGAGLRSSAHDIAGLASGYSGQLQQTVGDAGAELARHLAGLGAPGGVPSTAAAAGNVLYGLGGALPANELLTDAPFVEAAARALPGETLGYGQQQAAGALGQGAEQAAQLNPQIAAAYAKLPALQRSILTDLQSQAAKARQDAIANTFKALGLQQQGFTAEATRAYHQAQIDATAARDAQAKAHNATMEAVAKYSATTSRLNATTPKTGSFGSGGLYRQNPGGSVEILRKPDPAASASPKVGAPPAGYRYNPATNSYEKVPGLPPSATSKSGGITSSLVKDVAAQVSTWKSGLSGTDSGNPVYGGPKLDYEQALQHAIGLGPATKAWRNKATRLVQAEYGNPVVLARTAAVSGKQNGLHAVQQIASAIQSKKAGTLPFSLDIAIAAIARAYGVPPAAFSRITAELMQQAGLGG